MNPSMGRGGRCRQCGQAVRMHSEPARQLDERADPARGQRRRVLPLGQAAAKNQGRFIRRRQGAGKRSRISRKPTAWASHARLDSHRGQKDQCPMLSGPVAKIAALPTRGFNPQCRLHGGRGRYPQSGWAILYSLPPSPVGGVTWAREPQARKEWMPSARTVCCLTVRFLETPPVAASDGTL